MGKSEFEFVVETRQALWDAAAQVADAEMRKTPTIQGLMDVVATLGHLAASVWLSFVPPEQADIGGEDRFVNVMRHAFRNAAPRIEG